MKEFDAVRLKKPIGEFPAGTTGTIVHEYEEGLHYIVEVTPECKALKGLPLPADLTIVAHEADLELVAEVAK